MKKNTYMPKNQFRKLIFLSFAALLFALMISYDFAYTFQAKKAEFEKRNDATPQMQYERLAQSFLEGNLHFSDRFVTGYRNAIWDLAESQGKYYWPLPPLPAVFLMPLIALWSGIWGQMLLTVSCVILIFVLLYFISRKHNFSQEDSFLFSLVFCFGSMFIGMVFVPSSWFLAQTMSVLFVFAALLEFISKRRWWIIGILLGLTALTRLTAALSILFFIIYIFSQKEVLQLKFRKLLMLLIPFGLCLVIFGFYNHARFGNFLDQGYKSQTLFNPELAYARDQGLFSFKHLPGNLYYAFVKGPNPVFLDSSHMLRYPFIKPDNWGMSIFITCPYLIYLFWLRRRDAINMSLLAASVLVAIPIFLYYGIGWSQYGYRYALDFMPLLYLLFIRHIGGTYGAIPHKLKVLMLVSIMVNFYLFMSFFTTP